MTAAIYTGYKTYAPSPHILRLRRDARGLLCNRVFAIIGFLTVHQTQESSNPESSAACLSEPCHLAPNAGADAQESIFDSFFPYLALPKSSVAQERVVVPPQGGVAVLLITMPS